MKQHSFRGSILFGEGLRELIDARQSSATNISSVHLDWSTLKNNAPNSIPIRSDAQTRTMTATLEKIDLKLHSSA
jgi:hypothetical protein